MMFHSKDRSIEIKVGDMFPGKDIYSMGSSRWCYVYTVLDVEQGQRFGHPEILLTVKREAHDIDSHQKTIVDPAVKLWYPQCF